MHCGQFCCNVCTVLNSIKFLCVFFFTLFVVLMCVRCVVRNKYSFTYLRFYFFVVRILCCGLRVCFSVSLSVCLSVHRIYQKVSDLDETRAR